MLLILHAIYNYFKNFVQFVFRLSFGVCLAMCLVALNYPYIAKAVVIRPICLYSNLRSIYWKDLQVGASYIDLYLYKYHHDVLQNVYGRSSCCNSETGNYPKSESN